MLLVFSTDAWHNFESKELLGVAENKVHAFDIIEKFIERENIGLPIDERSKLSDDDIRNIMDIDQTQGVENSEFEFMLEEVTLNELIE